MATDKPKRPEHESERGQFRALLVSNPNYFGNLKDSPFKPVISIQSNKTYEEIGCVGFQPQLNRLEAVVYIKQPSGYGGGVCEPGTPEYVRFFLSFDDGATWVDQGYENFVAHDIPEGTAGAKRLEYALTRTVSPPKNFCFSSNLILARAILSWNALPPPDPDFEPVWGDVHDTHIQVDPLKLFLLGDIVKAAGVVIPPELSDVIDLGQPLTTAEPKALSVTELHTLYKGQKVEPHRYALAQVQQLVNEPALTESLMSPGFKGILGDIDIDIGDIIGKLFPTDGNTQYEELECVGFNPEQNAIVGVLRVKLPSGYSGGPCTTGSTEYVTFWADFNNNGTFETCLGTASVKVYDIAKMPKEGLEYSVRLPIDVVSHRRPCEEGPVVVPVRAIMSWQVAPPCGNPNYVPVWGNREETLIEIPPGPVLDPKVFTPFIYGICTVPVCSINQSTGYAIGDRPFGGSLFVTGEIPVAVALSVPDTLKYRISVRQFPAGSWQTVDNSFDITVEEGTGPGTAVSYSITQEIDADGFYTYREYGTGLGAWRRVTGPFNRQLGQWITAAPMSGMWEIKLEAKDTITNTIYQAGVTTCLADGSTRQTVKVWLDEVVPVPEVHIVGFSVGGGPVQPIVDCATLVQGVTIHGTYSVSDEHFGFLTLVVQPADSAGFTPVVPTSRHYGSPDFVPTTGESGTWTLDTTNMAPCGYTVRLFTRDRTIVSCGHGWEDHDFVGFCLDEPQS